MVSNKPSAANGASVSESVFFILFGFNYYCVGGRLILGGCDIRLFIFRSGRHLQCRVSWFILNRRGYSIALYNLRGTFRRGFWFFLKSQKLQKRIVENNYERQGYYYGKSFFIQDFIFLKLIQALVDRIVSSGMPRMTAADSLDRHKRPFPGAVFGECVDSIIGAGWLEPAVVSKYRWECQLIKANQEY